MDILFSLVLIGISSFIIWRSTDGFELASDFLGRKLTKGIKGATINAVASSMPEFLSTIFFLFYLKDSNGFSGGIGITGGSAVFNILVIPIAIYFVLFFAKGIKKIPVQRKTFLRDGILLFVLTGFVAWVVNSPTLQWWHGALLTLPYILYLIYLFASHKKIIGKGDNFEYMPQAKKIRFMDFPMFNLEKFILRGKPIRVTKAWWLLMASVLVMIAGTWMLVFATDLLGKQLDIPLLFVSVILAAAASSIPDTLISIRDAKKGNYEDAFSNALGSNIFDISFALGFPLLLYTLLNGSIAMENSISRASSEIWMALLAATGLVVLIFSSGRNYTLAKALLLILIYLAFILFIAIEVLNYSF
jgi:cation:H+ antiporter